MISYSNVIVYGEAGIGKTALLQAFAKVNPRAFKSINFHHGYEIEMDDSLLVPYLLPKPSHALSEPNTLIIIDRFDEIKSTAVKEKIAQIMIAGRVNGHRVILSARRQINEKVFERNARTMWLRGLRDGDIRQLVEMYDRQTDEHPDIVLTIRGMLESLKGNPREIISTLNFLLKQASNNNKEVVYQNPVVIEEIQKPTIILQEAPKIITDVRVVNKQILELINRQPQAIYQLTSRQFEMLVAELFEEPT